ncbi:putative lipopolysaccharide heptosyltransferase III [Halothermothrix orenii]|uniref:lipopolysaccharide heptosyltransferase II n=1 Tax=Halothermothrix orenii (strain H 168 / OCM 544 / DSM 9562) TaxID=373903 RepID=B8CZB7_HALOH|nr:putative lipopolysaccharide heptosyltransferase III [Halothermothrix orenii]ACL70636.1 lipopolysaccharide heptosyltransferase III, putative [Halothermothrix orenii H 168]
MTGQKPSIPDHIQKAKRILIIDLLYLGDLIFATPFIRNLRYNYPDARIDMVVNSNFHDIIAGNPYLDNIYPYDKKWDLKESFAFARGLKANNYDVGLNIHGNWRTALLLKLINPRSTAGFATRGRGIFLDKKLKPAGGCHMVEVYLDFLEELGLNIKNKDLELRLDKTAEDNMIAFLRKNGVRGKEHLVGINTGGTWPAKRWPGERFAALADRLQKEYEGVRVIFTGGPGDVDRVYSIIKKMETEPVVAAGKTTLPELVALVRLCDVVISGDTGPVHVSAAVGTPTLTLFGPSDEVKYRPYGTEHRIIYRDIDCRPCGQQECPEGHHRCLREISVDEVFEEIKKSGWF